MKRVTVEEFLYRSPLGENIFDNIAVQVADVVAGKLFKTIHHLDGAKYVLPLLETRKMERALAQSYYKAFYGPVTHGDRYMTLDELTGILDVLRVSRADIARLLHLKKPTLTKFYEPSGINPSLAKMLFRLLAMDLKRPGAVRHLMNGGASETDIPEARRSVERTIRKTRRAPRHVICTRVGH
ncbi:MAG: hypothetical protein EOP07_24065 [Proteobacteria bacterium]|nr:MAG: hypothetical protein EOP07_24065 [Pseudomonadota bacterium]